MPVVLTAFADESFQEDPVHGFYVLAAAVFPPAIHDQVRETMLDLRSRLRSRRTTDKLHWNHLDPYQQEAAAKQVAEIEGFHVVTVGTPVPQRRQERARAACLTRLVLELHSLGVTELVMEAREAELNRRDVQTVIGARYGLVGRPEFRVSHRFGSLDPLLWAADMVAGAVRAHRLGRPAPRDLLDDCLYEITIDTGCRHA
ncbi:DUF3800 domain-containing protein [Kutzneria kofuensis]|uniref:DUF3800 domain-containing protein n=1 Tax=Kutzneria kofuensis TaxID=103725 RepID=UPI00160A8D6F|nr:DUF3800 domain-containing protein [Kutzneria kofuensis]